MTMAIDSYEAGVLQGRITLLHAKCRADAELHHYDPEFFTRNKVAAERRIHESAIILNNGGLGKFARTLEQSFNKTETAVLIEKLFGDAQELVEARATPDRKQVVKTEYFKEELVRTAATLYEMNLLEDCLKCIRETVALATHPLQDEMRKSAMRRRNSTATTISQ